MKRTIHDVGEKKNRDVADSTKCRVLRVVGYDVRAQVRAVFSPVHGFAMDAIGLAARRVDVRKVAR